MTENNNGAGLCPASLAPADNAAPDSTITVAAVPLAIEWSNKTANLEKCDKILNGIRKDTDVVVFPEMFSTSFVVDSQLLADIAEPPFGPTPQWAASRARRHNLAICGSYITVKDGKYYNTAFFITPDGNATFYDKHHLFCLSPEAKLYGQGAGEMPVVRFRDWNFSFIVCYDMRFPVWCRNAGQKYDIMLVPANWPSVRRYAWHHLLVARAIENQTPWVGADRAGADDYGQYDGMAEIADAQGAILVQSDPAQPDVPLYATFSRRELNKLRKRWPVAGDADSFSLIPGLPLTPPPTHKF